MYDRKSTDKSKMVFLEAAHQAGLSPARHDPETQNDFFWKIGLNPTIQDRKLNFSYSLPWSLLASRDKNSEWRSLADEIRTYFEAQLKKI